VGKNLARVESGLAKRGSFDALTPGQQEAWHDVLEHNLYDLVGLRTVVRLAAEELAQIRQPAQIPA
jgi:hypothetical protein